MTNSFDNCAQQLIEAGRFINQRGWVPATSGNFSARLSDGNIAITASGRHKGHLTPDDILIIDPHGRSLDGRRSSAETLLHTALYSRYPKINAVLHPHSPGATLISRLKSDRVVLENFELLKALPGIVTHATKIELPIFENNQDIAQLAATVDQWITVHGDIHGYLIKSHGLYTWGDSVESALRHLEALEFLFDIELRIPGATHS
jgi:methylthioribulose-1-phosphate dehydratase